MVTDSLLVARQLYQKAVGRRQHQELAFFTAFA
jgi:hypothetical protein